MAGDDDTIMTDAGEVPPVASPPAAAPPDFLRIICTANTHNEDITASIPNGDVFIHAGGMTDFGLLGELQEAYRWISALDHPVKIVIAGRLLKRQPHTASDVLAGGHDIGLDKNHGGYEPEAFQLFTSAEAKARGIHYIDRETVNVDIGGHSIPVYGNSSGPKSEFYEQGKLGFIYQPHPSPEAAAAWTDAPRDVPIWVMYHTPALLMDLDPLEMWKPCPVQTGAIEQGKPFLCVFGHNLSAHGVTVVD